jgi:hypothetical protein
MRRSARGERFAHRLHGSHPHDGGIHARRRKRQHPARGVRPISRALADVVTTSAAAPSLMPDALPAVTLPSFLKAGLSAASFSAVVPARGYSSVSTRSGSPFFCATCTGTISSLNHPLRIAVSARFWLSAAKASWSARLMEKRVTISSAVMPMWQPWIAHVSPSISIVSYACACPIR